MIYILANPKIESKMIKSNKKSLDDVAEDLWSKYSKHIKNYADEFYFSFIQKGGKIYHYQVKESLKNNKVKYYLKKHNNKNTKNDINDKEFIEIINKELEQDGGRKHHDSSSSSSSEEELIIPSNIYSPLNMYPPNKLITYYPNIYGVNNISMPTPINRYGYVIKDGKIGIYETTSKGTKIYENKNGKYNYSTIIKK